MRECWLGIDVGSISTKGVIIDENNKIIATSYLWTEGNPMEAVKKVINNLERELKQKDIAIVGVGVTGSARKLIGSMVGANMVRNEITAHAIGTLSLFPNVKTILEIGGQDSKIIILEDGIVVDYAMNTLCAAGTGSFLSSQAKRLGVCIEDFGDIALKSDNPVRIAARCTVFAESDLVHKTQAGYKKEEIIAGLCDAVVNNYLNNVARGKKIKPPIVFQGGVSKNKGVIRSFEKTLNEKVYVDELGHLMGALGIAILSRETKLREPFSFKITSEKFETKGHECSNCSNHCEIVSIYKNKELIDVWGNRCEKGAK
ncbi:MAG: acyl-CoA dehydratase activase [Bacilli bacterium]|nr:acyl-CoA dehydratase activase [Bacilli bacterium]MDD3305411.1 acyl-CoA dehydratase activase [Bacilli bacterium]MDD4054137.1 acyl-CoA dehydratase activase [Bacilli bacterium]